MEYFKQEVSYLVRFARHNRDDKIKDKTGDTCSMLMGTETVLCTTFQLKRPLWTEYSRQNKRVRVNTIKNTGLSKKMDGIWNRYNLKSTGRIYTFGVLKCSEKFKVLDLP